MKDKHGLLREAVIVSDLVEHHVCKRIVPLRRYKYFEHDSAYRLYFIYCPHQTLATLTQRYRIWDTFLPELWLWHTFHQLPEAAVALEQPPPSNTQESIAPEDAQKYFTIHGDLKADNILLDYSPDYSDALDPLSQYPLVLMADFGVSMYTQAERDSTNPHMFWSRGTPGYLPPEQRGYGAHWRFAPSGVWGSPFANGDPVSDMAPFIKQYKQDQLLVFTSKMNVYAIGQIMYELVFLKAYGELDEKMTNSFQQYHENRSADNNGHSLNWQDFGTGRATEYSEDLLLAIYDCLQPEPATRPSANDLLTDLQERDLLKREIDRALDARPDDAKDVPGPAEKLFFEANTINDMPLGDAGKDLRADEVRYLAQAKDRDPDWPMLIAPQGAKWEVMRQLKSLPLAQPPERGQYAVVDRKIHWGVQKAKEIDYGIMTVKQMHDELKYRGITLQEFKRLRKDGLVGRLEEEDRKGNMGRGMWKRNVPRGLGKQPSAAGPVLAAYPRQLRSGRRR